MTSNATRATAIEPGVFSPDQLDELEAWFATNGSAILRGAIDPGALRTMTTECVVAQEGVATGRLDERHGTTILVDDTSSDSEAAVVNYVTYLTELAPVTRSYVTSAIVTELIGRWLGPEAWLLEHHRFGVVYQDARPGLESGYTRIGWHADWQSAPHRNMWPSVAFTIHIDATSPANGFLRVVPGSHQWATPAPYANLNGAVVPEGSAPWRGHTDTPPPFPMPLGFEKIRGEIGVYCEAGDILFHDAYLWHSAARATDDNTVRRHVRGGFYVGEEPTAAVEDDFVKNAAR